MNPSRSMSEVVFTFDSYLMLMSWMILLTSSLRASTFETLKSYKNAKTLAKFMNFLASTILSNVPGALLFPMALSAYFWNIAL